MLKAIVVETQRQNVGIGIIQSLDVGIITIGMEIVVVLNMDVDAPLSSLIDSIASLKVMTIEGEGVGARSLAHSTLRVEGRAGTPGWGLGRFTSKSITHKDLHKPNNKLVNA
jgi:hypothetical protein